LTSLRLGVSRKGPGRMSAFALSDPPRPLWHNYLSCHPFSSIYIYENNMLGLFPDVHVPYKHVRCKPYVWPCRKPTTASLLNLWMSQPVSGLVESSRPQSLLVSPESSGSRLSRGMHGLRQKNRLAPTTRQSLAVNPAACFGPSFSAWLVYLAVCLCWTCVFVGRRSCLI